MFKSTNEDVQDLQDLRVGKVRDDEVPAEEMDPGQLSRRQLIALKTFHNGSTLAAAAKAAGVSRQTLHRWRIRYEAFGQAMKSWEVAAFKTARSRLVGMIDLALDNLANDIEDGDGQAAIDLLFTVRVLQKHGPTPVPKEELESAGKKTKASVQAQGVFEALMAEPAEMKRDGAETEQALRPSSLRLDSVQAGQAPAIEACAVIEQAPTPALPRSTRGGGIEGAAGGEGALPVAAMQHHDVTSELAPKAEKAAIPAGKAGLAIKMACDGALQNVTAYCTPHRTQNAGIAGTRVTREEPMDNG